MSSLTRLFIYTLISECLWTSKIDIRYSIFDIWYSKYPLFAHFSFLLLFAPALKGEVTKKKNSLYLYKPSLEPLSNMKPALWNRLRLNWKFISQGLPCNENVQGSPDLSSNHHQNFKNTKHKTTNNKTTCNLHHSIIPLFHYSIIPSISSHFVTIFVCYATKISPK